MEITFNLPHAFYPNSSPISDVEVLKILLDTLVKIDVAYARRFHPVPLYESGVIYGRTTLWEPIPALYARKYGDCKSLSAALISEYLLKGIPAKPVFRFRTRNDGGKDFHILVLVNGDRWEDPSAKLGMGKNELKWFK